MNGAKELDQIVSEEGRRMPRNAAMLAQQLKNEGFDNVKATWTIKFTVDAPDGSGRMTKSIVGSIDKLVAGNGTRSTGGNGQTSLANALANSGSGPGVTVPVVRVSKSSDNGAQPARIGSAFNQDDDD